MGANFVLDTLLVCPWPFESTNSNTRYRHYLLSCLLSCPLTVQSKTPELVHLHFMNAKANKVSLTWNHEKFTGELGLS